jgi:hypothetical protein
MALTWVKFEGFEDGNAGIILPLGIGAYSTTTPRTGSGCFLVAANPTVESRGWKIMIPNLTDFYFQYALRRVGAGNVNDDGRIFTLRSALGQVLLSFYMRPAVARYDVYLGDKATLLGEVGAFSTSWNIFEGYFKADEDNGQVKIWYESSLIIDYTGNTGTSAVASMIHTNDRQSAGSGDFYFDDIAIGDDRLYGAAFHKIATLTQGHYDQWTPQGDVAALNCVTPTPPSMDKYIKTTTDGHKQSFGHTGYTPADGIGAVIARHYGQGGGQVTLGRRHNSTDYMEVAPVGLPGAFGVLDQIYFEKPGGGAWDKTTLDATEFIIEAEIPA